MYPRSQIDVMLERAWNFKGKRNTDWIPFITTFPDFPIPDMPFCLVPVGEFMMGSDDTKNASPVHKQIITEPYWIAQHPVTNAQWQYVVEKSGGKIGVPDSSYSPYLYDDISRGNYPVQGLTWYQAQDFVEWVGCCLPTELQWEYAARGIENWVYPWGNELNGHFVVPATLLPAVSLSIGSRPKDASWVSAQDLSGNVREWCSTIYNQYPYQSNSDFENVSSSNMRVLRGAFLYSTSVSLASAYRSGSNPSDRLFNGFRCALAIDGSAR